MGLEYAGIGGNAIVHAETRPASLPAASTRAGVPLASPVPISYRILELPQIYGLPPDAFD